MSGLLSKDETRFKQQMVLVNGHLCDFSDGNPDVDPEDYIFDTEEAAWADLDEFIASWNNDIPEHNPLGEPYSLDDFEVVACK